MGTVVLHQRFISATKATLVVMRVEQAGGGDGGGGDDGGSTGGGFAGVEGGGGGFMGEADGGGRGKPVGPQACMPPGHDAAF